MAIITRLVQTAARSNKVRVFLDGVYAFSLPLAIVLELKIGQDLSSEHVEKLLRSARQQDCLASAERFLSNRPHSENELQQKLLRRGFSQAEVADTLAKLKKTGLIDDLHFASFWTENREAFRPRSKYLTALELKRKGVAQEIIEQTTIQTDDALNAYHAAIKKARVLGTLEYETFLRRLGQYLARRGFGYEVIKRTVNRIWDEQHRDSGNTEMDPN